MVKITNGIEYFEVPSGAYKSVFKKQGFVKVEEPKKVTMQSPVETPAEDDPYMKPLGQWSKEEVKAYASEHGIDISNTKNVAEAKQRIKAYLDNK